MILSRILVADSARVSWEHGRHWHNPEWNEIFTLEYVPCHMASFPVSREIFPGYFSEAILACESSKNDADDWGLWIETHTERIRF